MVKSLVDIFCPVGGRIVKIVGKRVIGVSDSDSAALGMFDSRVGSGDITEIYANLSWNEMKTLANGHVFSSGGAPNMYSMLAQYPGVVELLKQNPGAVYPFTLEDMIRQIDERPEEPPIRWIYHAPVFDVLKEAESSRKNDLFSKLLQALGIATMADYTKLRFLPDVSNIGFTQPYKDLGVTTPLWRVEATAVRPDAGQKPVSRPAIDVPFREGYDYFLILAGKNFVNPDYGMITFVGGRGPSTFAAELLAIGKDAFSRRDIESTRVQTAMKYMKLPEDTHQVRGLQSTSSEIFGSLVELLSPAYGSEFRGAHLNVAILGETHIKDGLPIRISGPLDIRAYNPAPA